MELIFQDGTNLYFARHTSGLTYLTTNGTVRANLATNISIVGSVIHGFNEERDYRRATYLLLSIVQMLQISIAFKNFLFEDSIALLHAPSLFSLGAIFYLLQDYNIHSPHGKQIAYIFTLHCLIVVAIYIWLRGLGTRTHALGTCEGITELVEGGVCSFCFSFGNNRSFVPV